MLFVENLYNTHFINLPRHILKTFEYISITVNTFITQIL